VRCHRDGDKEKWFFSIVDVVEVLTESRDAGTYWRKLKERLKKEGNETVQIAKRAEKGKSQGPHDQPGIGV
jgi:hypothetical protein